MTPFIIFCIILFIFTKFNDIRYIINLKIVAGFLELIWCFNWISIIISNPFIIWSLPLPWSKTRIIIFVLWILSNFLICKNKSCLYLTSCLYHCCFLICKVYDHFFISWRLKLMHCWYFFIYRILPYRSFDHLVSLYFSWALGISIILSLTKSILYLLLQMLIETSLFFVSLSCNIFSKS